MWLQNDDRRKVGYAGVLAQSGASHMVLKLLLIILHLKSKKKISYLFLFLFFFLSCS